MARPTDYNQEIVDKAWDYANNFLDYGDAFPSVVGLCRALNRGRSTIYEWAEDKEKEFPDILSTIKENQEHIVFNRSMTNDYNSAMAKLLLTKHGYSDKQDNTLSGPGGNPIQVDNHWTVEIVDA